jgi:hypothetical protein
MIKLLTRLFRPYGSVDDIPATESQPETPFTVLSRIDDWRQAYHGMTTARAKHRKVKPHYIAMREALHKDMGMMQ